MKGEIREGRVYYFMVCPHCNKGMNVSVSKDAVLILCSECNGPLKQFRVIKENQTSYHLIPY